MATPQEKAASVLWLVDIKSLCPLFSVVSGVNTDINLQHTRAPPFGTAVRRNSEVSFVMVCVMNKFRDTMFFWLFIIRTPSVLFHLICSNFNVISIACLDNEVLFIKCKMYVALNGVNRYFSLWQSEILETLQ